MEKINTAFQHYPFLGLPPSAYTAMHISIHYIQLSI
jgi:hypothetical protein